MNKIWCENYWEFKKKNWNDDFLLVVRSKCISRIGFFNGNLLNEGLLYIYALAILVFLHGYTIHGDGDYCTWELESRHRRGDHSGGLF